MESIQKLLQANQLKRANIVLKQLFKVESLTLDVDGYVLIQDNSQTQNHAIRQEKNPEKRIFLTNDDDDDDDKN